MPRLFIAINLPDYVKDELGALQRNDIPGTRRTTRNQMHVTLHFIGDVDDGVQADLMAVLSAVQAEPFELALGGVGQFPPNGKPRVLWAGVQENSQLQQLHKTIGKCLTELGIEIEKRPYTPHLTLARLKITPPRHAVQNFLEEHAQFHTVPFRVEEFVLFSSELRPQGARYTAELSVPLAVTGDQHAG